MACSDELPQFYEGGPLSTNAYCTYAAATHMSPAARLPSGWKLQKSSFAFREIRFVGSDACEKGQCFRRGYNYTYKHCCLGSARSEAIDVVLMTQ